ncbi:MAG: hypothetical protein HQ472_01050 [Ignavibacteria bacterium]|nr:hypothetical protein [Ignavibacteria bacterium]
MRQRLRKRLKVGKCEGACVEAFQCLEKMDPNFPMLGTQPSPKATAGRPMTLDRSSFSNHWKNRVKFSKGWKPAGPSMKPTGKHYTHKRLLV